MKGLAVFLLFLSFGHCRRDTKIVGGVEVDPPGKWPWQGALLFSGSHNCGAVLVSENYVLTAAHCVGSTNLDVYTIVLGQHDRIAQNEGQPEEYKAEAIRAHPGFINDGSLGFPNDIAIIKLTEPANVSNEFIDFLPLDTGDTNRAGDDCLISGWGRTCGGCALPDLLQEADIGVINVTACNQIWNDITPVEVRDFHICVYDEPNYEKGACNGDSGGPLVCSVDEGENYELCGITSWGLSGCGTSAPSVYTRVAYFNDWICVWTQGEVGNNCEDVTPPPR